MDDENLPPGRNLAERRAAAAASAELAAAREARPPYQRPESLTDLDGRHRRKAPVQGPLESYITQQYVLRTDGQLLVLRPGETDDVDHGGTEAAALATTLGLDGPDSTLHLVSAWNPRGRATAEAANLLANDALAADVVRRGGIVRAVLAAMPADRTWVEDTLLISGLDEATAAALARTYEQVAYVRLDGDRLVVMATTEPGKVVASMPWRAVLRPRTCPMRLDNPPAGKCVLDGGPYSSKSIHAAAVWKAHRSVLLRRLGCATCGDGTQPTLGMWGGVVGAVMVADAAVASRHGGFCWLPERPASSDG